MSAIGRFCNQSYVFIRLHPPVAHPPLLLHPLGFPPEVVPQLLHPIRSNSNIIIISEVPKREIKEGNTKISGSNSASGGQMKSFYVFKQTIPLSLIAFERQYYM